MESKLLQDILVVESSSIWCKPNLCTVRIRTLGVPGQGQMLIRVSKARLLSQTLAYPEVVTCHIIALAQDCSRGLHSRVDVWYIGHSARHTPTKISSHSDEDTRSDYDYQVIQRVLVRNNGILCKAESRYLREPWLTTSVHTNGTIRVQCGNKSERMNIQRVKPFDNGTNI